MLLAVVGVVLLADVEEVDAVVMSEAVDVASVVVAVKAEAVKNSGGRGGVCDTWASTQDAPAASCQPYWRWLSSRASLHFWCSCPKTS